MSTKKAHVIRLTSPVNKCGDSPPFLHHHSDHHRTTFHHRTPPQTSLPPQVLYTPAPPPQTTGRTPATTIPSRFHRKCFIHRRARPYSTSNTQQCPTFPLRGMADVRSSFAPQLRPDPSSSPPLRPATLPRPAPRPPPLPARRPAPPALPPRPRTHRGRRHR